jgi:precorrin-6Y C5,15-methyltransferase (decarboxylating)
MKEKSLQTANKIFVIGIGYRPLDERAKKIVCSADVLFASGRLSEVFQRYDEYAAVKDKITVINNVDQTIQAIRVEQQKKRKVVLLASGDPQFFGIGRRAVEEFGMDAVELLPDLSSIQIAFARIKEPWDDAFLISLHGGPDIAKRRRLPYEAGDIPRLLERYGKMAVLTDKVNNPSVIATVIARSETTKQSQPQGIASPLARNDGITMIVCERLGYPDEKIMRGTPEEMAGMSFSDPNVVIIMKEGARGQGPGVRGQAEDNRHETNVMFGLREDEIEHERGMITKDEVRAATVHKLRLPDSGVFWDIGAGSGSVSVEAARLCPALKIIAVEMNEERIAVLKNNIKKFSIRNIEVLYGAAPEVLTALPDPDRVFIGGSGGRLNTIVQAVGEKMSSGIIVINAVTLDTLNNAVASLGKNGFKTEVSQISVSRSKVVSGTVHLNALNPVFIIKGEKG